MHLCGDCLVAVVDGVRRSSRAHTSAGACIACGTPNTPVHQTALPNGVVARARRCEACLARVDAWRRDAVRRRAERSRDLLTMGGTGHRPSTATTDDAPATAVTTDRGSRTALLVALGT